MLSGNKILIVEDDGATRDLTRKMLEKEGVTVATAENGKIGIEYLEKNIPGLILLDLMMPEMDGFEFIEVTRKHPEWIKIPIVVVTSKDLTQEEKKQLHGNVETVLQKGQFDKNDLIQMVSEVIEKQ